MRAELKIMKLVIHRTKMLKSKITTITLISDIISKLRSQNVKLRQKLKELNSALDVALEKAQKNMTSKKTANQVPQSVDNIIRVKDKELSNQN